MIFPLNEKAKAWVSNVMQCLQKKFWQFFINNPNYEGRYIFHGGYPDHFGFNNIEICSTLRNKAFDSHINCYVRPTGSTDDGICWLGSNFAEIKNSLDIFVTTDPIDQITNLETKSLYFKQFAGTMRACRVLYAETLEEKIKDTLILKSSSKLQLSKKDLRELIKVTQNYQKKYNSLAFEIQSSSNSDDSISNAIKNPNYPFQEVKYQSQEKSLTIPSGKVLTISRDTIYNVEELIIGNDVTIILTNGAQLNIKASRSKIGNNFKIISEVANGRNAPQNIPATLGQAAAGEQGKNGIHGRAGESGSNASSIELRLGKVESMGSIDIKLNGGNGGKGQTGGNAQQGGGGECESGKHPMFGGKGGTAGQGGYGGSAGNVRLVWSQLKSKVSRQYFNNNINIESKIGIGGVNGLPGTGAIAGESQARCCKFIIKKWCGEFLEIEGTPGSNGRYQEGYLNYGFNSRLNANIYVFENSNEDFNFSDFSLDLANSDTSEIHKYVNNPEFSNDAHDKNGDTPLTLLLRSNSSEQDDIYDILRKKKINPNTPSKDGISPVQLLVKGNYLFKDRLLSKMVEDGAHLNYPNILSDVVTNNDPQLLRFLLKNKTFTLEEIIEAHKKASGRTARLLLDQIRRVQDKKTVTYLESLYTSSKLESEKRKIIHDLGIQKSPSATSFLIKIYKNESNITLKNLSYSEIEKRRDEIPSQELLAIQLTSRKTETLKYVFNAGLNLPNREIFLQNNLSHIHPVARAAAAEAIGKIKSTNSLSALLDLLKKERKRKVKKSIIWSIGEIGDKRAIPILEKLLRSGPISLSTSIVEALKKLKGETSYSIDELISKLYDKNGQPDDYIIRLLVSKGEQALIKVANNLNKMSETSGIIPFSHYAVIEFSPFSKKIESNIIKELQIRKTLSFLMPAIAAATSNNLTSAIPALKRLLNHPNSDIREKAQDALEKISTSTNY